MTLERLGEPGCLMQVQHIQLAVLAASAENMLCPSEHRSVVFACVALYLTDEHAPCLIYLLDAAAREAQ